MPATLEVVESTRSPRGQRRAFRVYSPNDTTRKFPVMVYVRDAEAVPRCSAAYCHKSECIHTRSVAAYLEAK